VICPICGTKGEYKLKHKNSKCEYWECIHITPRGLKCGSIYVVRKPLQPPEYDDVISYEELIEKGLEDIKQGRISKINLDEL